MVAAEFFSQVVQCFIPLFIILDPFLSLAVFISLTKGMDSQERAKQALIASSVAFTLLVIFLFSGLLILNSLGIELSSLMVGGGVILLLLGIQAVLGLEFTKKKKNYKAAAVIIGTPLLCGPGAITTVILLSEQYGYWPPFIAALAAIIITYFMLLFADKISKVLGDKMVEIISRVLGLILCALAAEIIKNGVIRMIDDFKTEK
jgi:multiple antibiotic resistance protein